MSPASAEKNTDTRAPQGLRGALVFSLVLHTCLLLALARTPFVPTAPTAAAAAAEQQQVLQLTLLQRPAPKPLAAQVDVPPPPSQPPPQAEALPATANSQATPDLSANPATTGPAAGGDTTGESSDKHDAVSGTTPEPFTAGMLRDAITTEVARLRQEFADDWIAECMIRAKERGFGKDCQHEEALQAFPAQQAAQEAAVASFADVLRPGEHARLTTRLEQQNRQLKPLIKTGDVLGQLARERYWIDFEQVLYLNGNPSPYGPDKQFNCRNDPCIYEYSPFVITRPSAPPDENAFERKTTLFGSPR